MTRGSRRVSRRVISPGYLFAFLVMLTAVVHAPALYASETIERAVTGKWRFVAALDGADMTSLDEAEARQLVGHVFLISKERVKFGERDCGSTNFDAQKVEPEMFLRNEFRADADKLGLPNPVTVVDLNCTSVFIKKANRLVIAWKGWFFEAVRTK